MLQNENENLSGQYSIIIDNKINAFLKLTCSLLPILQFPSENKTSQSAVFQSDVKILKSSEIDFI